METKGAGLPPVHKENQFIAKILSLSLVTLILDREGYGPFLLNHGKNNGTTWCIPEYDAHHHMVCRQGLIMKIRELPRTGEPVHGGHLPEYGLYCPLVRYRPRPHSRLLVVCDMIKDKLNKTDRTSLKGRTWLWLCLMMVVAVGLGIERWNLFTYHGHKTDELSLRLFPCRICQNSRYDQVGAWQTRYLVGTALSLNMHHHYIVQV